MPLYIHARARPRQWPLWDAPPCLPPCPARPRNGARGIRLGRPPVPDVLEGILNPARPFLPDEADRAGHREEILSIQTAGLARRVEHTRTPPRAGASPRTRTHAHTHARTQAGRRTSTRARTHASGHTHACTRMHTHACTRMHTHAHTRMHEHTAGKMFHVEHAPNHVPREAPRKNARRNTLQNQRVTNAVKKI